MIATLTYKEGTKRHVAATHSYDKVGAMLRTM